MRKRLYLTFAAILLIAGISGYISWPTTQEIKIGSYYRDVSLRQGLDLKGGVHLVYEADTSKIDKANVAQSIEALRGVIESRVNGLGVTEPEIRTTNINGKTGIIIDMPGLTSVEKAKEIVGSTAKLEFKDANGTVLLEGKDLVTKGAQPNPKQASSSTSQVSTGSEWQVDLSFNADGKEKFAKATAENTGKQISIYLDDKLIMSPTVQEAITDGKAVISGSFDAQAAKDFALKINYGALPVPISLVQEQSIGPSLGADAIGQSIFAGIVGTVLVMIYLIGFYKWSGLVACLSLLFYALVNIFLYKTLPITMTLAGIAGFIISMGIAVDTNILTLERLKEELRLNKPMAIAVQEAFKRAWTSIRDSHISGVISALIIFTFGSGSVRGFALVLLIGTLLSLFSAITVTRNWMLLIAGSRFNKILKP